MNGAIICLRNEKQLGENLIRLNLLFYKKSKYVQLLAVIFIMAFQQV
jgi:hypothetical protein